MVRRGAEVRIDEDAGSFFVKRGRLHAGVNAAVTGALLLCSLGIVSGCVRNGPIDVIPDIYFVPAEGARGALAAADTSNKRTTSTLEALSWDHVVFFEDFEDPDYYRYWSLRDGRPLGVGTVSSPQRYVFAGERSAIMLNHRDKHDAEGNGKYVLQEPIEEQAYVRLYLRLSDHFTLGSANGLKLFSIVATKGPDFYRGAGHRPTGYDRFGATMVLDSWDEVFIYSYHPEQRSGYGDEIYGKRKKRHPKVKPGDWYCLELMMKANVPGQRDGQLKAWVNDELVIQADNIRFRDTDQVKMWRFYTPGYFGGGGIRNTSPKEQQIYIDNYVISRARVGCLEF